MTPCSMIVVPSRTKSSMSVPTGLIKRTIATLYRDFPFCHIFSSHGRRGLRGYVSLRHPLIRRYLRSSVPLGGCGSRRVSRDEVAQSMISRWLGPPQISEQMSRCLCSTFLHFDGCEIHEIVLAGVIVRFRPSLHTRVLTRHFTASRVHPDVLEEPG